MKAKTTKTNSNKKATTKPARKSVSPKEKERAEIVTNNPVDGFPKETFKIS